MIFAFFSLLAFLTGLAPVILLHGYIDIGSSSSWVEIGVEKDSARWRRRKGRLGRRDEKHNLDRIKNSLSSDGNTRNETSKPIIAYVVPIVYCGNDRGGQIGWKSNHSFLDAAMIIHHSIRRNSHPVHPTSNYSYEMIALVIVDSGKEAKCEPTLDLLRTAGYKVRVRKEPVHHPLWHIRRNLPGREKRGQGNATEPRIKSEPCCGPKEFIKLRAYQLIEYPVVVMLDMDAILLRPLDVLFDAMIYSGAGAKTMEEGDIMTSRRGEAARESLVEEGLLAPTRYSANDKFAREQLPRQINAFYTRDWGSATPKGAKWVGLQGGFLVLRPSLQAYQSLVDILQDGNFVEGWGKGSGWGASGYGYHIYGAMTFQGLMAYYQEVNATIKGVELHSCKFNLMASNPRMTSGSRISRSTPINQTSAGYSDGRCRDARKNCDDVQCQTWDMARAYSVHYTHCRKPWTCPAPESNSLRRNTCAGMHREWFRVRQELEEELRKKGMLERDRESVAAGKFEVDSFLGYCNESGVYNPMEFVGEVKKVFS